MNTMIAQDAISAALSGDWEQAVLLNEQLTTSNPHDIDALNRLAHAFYELGKIDEARKTYARVLKIDRYNPIAQRSLKKAEAAKTSSMPAASQVNPTLFIEEPSITKIVRLLRPGSPQVLSKMSIGMPVLLTFKHRSLAVITQDGLYLGILPDELARQLQPRIRAGNQYEAHISSIRPKEIGVFLRETRRIGRYRTHPTFLSLTDTNAEPVEAPLGGDELGEAEDTQKDSEEHEEFV